ncbi:DNA translocase FtsK [Brucella pseudogrignonensis]|uniref:S-DNA-T family DNA segregation ATPase FtsK/SpoIIIE n=1 Tax=Brucella pseudogrignonensis TaxID=419475 RepID=A0ABU1M8A1_9HYPH|nr:DNA translocase FtsK [Brucella pseudogrignonensis]MDR6432265.1 S-DNA-T family DNA segregation ATPase FtsK/SpoIIIE [Brucella pseudogrignonensis]
MRNLRENLPHTDGNRAESAPEQKPQRDPLGAHSPDSDGAWKSYFSLGANVRFTRTPEIDLVRRRGEDLPDINGRAKPAVVEAAPIEIEKVAVVQPMAVAALQESVSQNMVRTPVAPVPPVLHTPVIQPVETAPVQFSSEIEATSASDVSAAISAFAHLSDFAFWESFDFDSAPVQPVSVVAEVATPKRAVPTVESIIAQFRTVEWNKAKPQEAPVAVVEQPAPVAEVAQPVQVTPAPQPVAARVAEVKIEAPRAPIEVAAPNAPVEAVADVAAETTEDEVVLTVAEAEEHVVEEVAAPAPVAEAPKVEAPAKTAPSIALYQPQPLPRTEAVVIHGDYEFPPRDLLQEPPSLDGNVITQEMLERSAGLLESVLEDFGVRGEIIHVRPGPVVTLYEFEPAPGVKSSRVIGLSDDIARSMSALSARVAVIPGRNVIGIELPNASRETVYLREMIDSRTFESSNYRLPLCLGKGIGGEPIIAELAKMPHLLVAGTTGSGKSVAINTMILSLLYRFKPEECRLIMVDPKMLELSIYDGIPHLLTPVVTDPKKAVVALKWAVREMEDRYRKMARLGVRNIEGFNQRAASAKGKGETVMCTVQSGFDKETGEATYVQEELDLTPMPYIVVIIDEMADLMMVAGKDIEGAVQRLAQMARAAGIHLIMATQRPSVDVITGTIKANFPTRISFQVTSKIDSRTILGEMGAEQLLGQGDMLHMAGGGRIVRVHGPFVSDEEVEKVVNHLKEQGRPDYLATVTEDEEDEDTAQDTAVFDASAMGSEDSDDVYEQAVKVVLRDKKCSTSYIQRRLGIGYNRAASLVERMEQEGLVGAANHVGKREILTGNRD